MKDFLKGEIGRFAQLVLAIIGLILLIMGLASCGNSNTTTGTFLVILGVLCWCTVAGIRYWLGIIVRSR